MKESTTLAFLSKGRDNNLNLMRVLAALLVLFSHCYTLTTGNSASEPGRAQVHLTLGDLAVDIFFVMSGFLVSKSLARSQSLKRYSLARAFRIYPGLWVALLLTTGVVCTAYSTAPLATNLQDSDVWLYLLQNAVSLFGTAFGFAGAFAYNPYPAMVNASLWTLPLELWMYILLGFIWGATRWIPPRSPSGYGYVIRAVALLAVIATLALDVLGHPSNSLRHASMFYVAAALYTLEDRVRFHGAVFLAMLAALVATALLAPAAFELPYRLCLPYLVLYLAFVPGGLIRQYNRCGDYSYGIYIYAFPIQQMVADSVPRISIAGMFCLAGALTLLCAMATLHIVEKPAMNWRARRDGRATVH